MSEQDDVKPEESGEGNAPPCPEDVFRLSATSPPSEGRQGVFTVRFLNRADARALRRIRLESFITHYGPSFVELFEQEAKKSLHDWEVSATPSENGCYVGAFNPEGELVGIMGAKRFDVASTHRMHSDRATALPLRPRPRRPVKSPIRDRNVKRSSKPVRSTVVDADGFQPIRPKTVLFYGTYFKKKYRGVMQDGDLASFLEKKAVIAACYDIRERFVKSFGYEDILLFIRPEDSASSQNHLTWGAEFLGRERMALTLSSHTRKTLWDWYRKSASKTKDPVEENEELAKDMARRPVDYGDYGIYSLVPR